MMSKNRLGFVHSALAGGCCFTLILLSGCSQEAPSAASIARTNSVSTSAAAKALPAVYTLENHAYREDPAFQASWREQNETKQALLGQIAALQARFEALAASCASQHRVAEETATGKEILSELATCQAKLEANLESTRTLLGARMRRAKEDGEKVARGEAVAIDISKREVTK